MTQESGRDGAPSVWFLVGLMILVCGIAMLPFGANEWLDESQAASALDIVHPTLWWGLSMTFFGLVYVLKYRPRQ